MFGNRGQALMQFRFRRELRGIERLIGDGVPHHHPVRRLTFGAREQPGKAIVVADGRAFAGQQVSDAVEILKIEAGGDHLGNGAEHGGELGGSRRPGRFVELAVPYFRETFGPVRLAKNREAYRSGRRRRSRRRVCVTWTRSPFYKRYRSRAITHRAARDNRHRAGRCCRSAHRYSGR